MFVSFFVKLNYKMFRGEKIYAAILLIVQVTASILWPLFWSCDDMEEEQKDLIQSEGSSKRRRRRWKHRLSRMEVKH